MIEKDKLKENKKMKPNSRDRFVDLAEKRVSKVLKDIKLIGNLSNKSNYDYDQKDTRKIFAALRKAVDDCRSRFEQGGRKDDEIFKL